MAQRVRLCQAFWAVTSRDIFHLACLSGNFFRPGCRSITVAAGVLACCCWILGLRPKKVNKYSETKHWQLGEWAVGFYCSIWKKLLQWVCDRSCTGCTLRSAEKALCKVAWQEKQFCPPTGMDLLSVYMNNFLCRERMEYSAWAIQYLNAFPAAPFFLQHLNTFA